MFDELFSPIDFGPVQIKNRIDMAPHALDYLKDGLVSPALVDYYEERAKGGAGCLEMSQLYVRPPTGIVMTGWEESDRKSPMVAFPNIVPGLMELSTAAHRHGAKILMEVSSWSFIYGPVSSVPFQSGHLLREVTPAGVKQIHEDFAMAVGYVKDGGFDGIDLHGTHGSMIEHWLSPAINRRRDSYGGSHENRMRFLSELIDVIRSAVGNGMALGMRLCGDEELEGGIDPDYAARIVESLDGRLDFVTLDVGAVFYNFNTADQVTRQTQSLYAEPGHNAHISEKARKVAKRTKVGVVGRVTDPLLANTIIQRGQADFVGMVRALIADPELPNKAREGRLDEVRPCIATQEGCLGRNVRGLAVRCTVNPAVGREGAWGSGRIQHADKTRRVLVVGGGPAGLEAARVAASRGHEVTLYERTGELGGQVNLAKMLPGRSDVGAIVSWYASQLKGLNVKVVLHTEVPEDASVVHGLVEMEQPDVVILATGSTPLRTGLQALTFKEVPGWDSRNVRTVDEVLANRKPLEGQVVVADATTYVEGPAIAEWLARHGSSHVTWLSPQQVITFELQAYSQGITLYRRLRQLNVKMMTHTWLRRIEEGKVVAYNIPTETEEDVKADHVVLVSGRKQNNALTSLFSRFVKEVYEVGDCDVAGGRIGRAIESAFRTGQKV